jgi:hypothetical protein
LVTFSAGEEDTKAHNPESKPKATRKRQAAPSKAKQAHKAKQAKLTVEEQHEKEDKGGTKQKKKTLAVEPASPKQETGSAAEEKPAAKGRGKRQQKSEEASPDHKPTAKRARKTKAASDKEQPAKDSADSNQQGATEKGQEKHKAKSSTTEPDWLKSEDRRHVRINRAPVLTAWVAAVAERQGYSHDAGLTFGKAISGMLAHSKGRSIGIYGDKDKSEDEKEEQRHKEEAAGFSKHDVFGMHIKAKDVGNGDVRAKDHEDKVVNPKQVAGYLHRAFGDHYEDAMAAFKDLAESYEAQELGHQAYKLYESFRPSVQHGQGGWGQKGLLDLGVLHQLAHGHQH